MAQSLQQDILTIEVEGVGRFDVPVGTTPEEIARLADEFEKLQSSTAEPSGSLTPLAAPPTAPPGARHASPLAKATKLSADPHPAINRLLDLLPPVGATIGSVLGGTGGTAFGAGFGGYPSAIAGAGFGGGAGEAIRQLSRRILERPSPNTPQEAAKDIGIEALMQAGLEATGRLPGKALQVTGRQIFKGGLMEKAPETFGDLSKMVKGGSIHPDKALQQAFGLIKQLQKEAPFFMSHAGEKETLRQAAGQITSKEARGLARKSRYIVPEVAKAQRALVSMLDSVIQANPTSQASQTAQQIKSLIGLARAETATIGRTPSAGAAALGGLLGTTGGFAGGGPVGGVLGGMTGVGIPLFLGGHPTTQRALGKGVAAAGRGLEPAIPAGARGLYLMLQELFKEEEEPQP